MKVRADRISTGLRSQMAWRSQSCANAAPAFGSSAISFEGCLYSEDRLALRVPDFGMLLSNAPGVDPYNRLTRRRPDHWATCSARWQVHPGRGRSRNSNDSGPKPPRDGLLLDRVLVPRLFSSLHLPELGDER